MCVNSDTHVALGQYTKHLAQAKASVRQDLPSARKPLECSRTLASDPQNCERISDNNKRTDETLKTRNVTPEIAVTPRLGLLPEPTCTTKNIILTKKYSDSTHSSRARSQGHGTVAQDARCPIDESPLDLHRNQSNCNAVAVPLPLRSTGCTQSLRNTQSLKPWRRSVEFFGGFSVFCIHTSQEAVTCHTP